MSDHLLPVEIETLAARVIAENAATSRKIATAESCTGGLVSAALTEISGSSAVFEYGFVTYANAAKTDLLGVDANLLELHGAVSIEAASAMAQGAVDRSGADVAVAISGVAGPGGGSEDKPVGTVIFALAARGGAIVSAERKDFSSNLSRAEIRKLSAIYALELLRPSSA